MTNKAEGGGVGGAAAGGDSTNLEGAGLPSTSSEPSTETASNGAEGIENSGCPGVEQAPDASASSFGCGGSSSSNGSGGAEPAASATGAAGAAGDGEGIHRKNSMSETAQLSAGGWDAPFPLNVIFEAPFRIPDPRTKRFVQEATGWAMDGAGRGPLNQIGGYIGSAVLLLASLDAGCDNPRQCDATVGSGLKPSSLLTLVSTLVGVCAAVLMP